MSYTLIQETRERLQAMNTVVASSITAWNLVGRLHRLSVETYRYRESDWLYYPFYGLRNQNNTLSAILALTNDALELPGDLNCLQIHGSVCACKLSASRRRTTAGRSRTTPCANEGSQCRLREISSECRLLF